MFLSQATLKEKKIFSKKERLSPPIFNPIFVISEKYKYSILKNIRTKKRILVQNKQ